LELLLNQLSYHCNPKKQHYGYHLSQKQMTHQQTWFSQILDCYTVKCSQQNQDSDTNWRWEKTQEGGVWIVCTFSSFSPTEVTDQKQLDYNFWSDVQILNAADKNKEKEREKKDTKQLYRFLPQTGSSPVPLALPRRVH